MDTPPPILNVNDEAYRFLRRRKINVFLDGVEQKMVVAYDTEAGTIERHKLNGEGLIYLEPGTEDIATETVRGAVRVEWGE